MEDHSPSHLVDITSYGFVQCRGFVIVDAEVAGTIAL